MKRRKERRRRKGLRLTGGTGVKGERDRNEERKIKDS